MKPLIFQQEVYCSRNSDGKTYSQSPKSPHDVLELVTDYVCNTLDAGIESSAIPKTVIEAAALSFYLAYVSGSRPESLMSNAKEGFANLALTEREGLEATASMLRLIGEADRAHNIELVLEGDVGNVSDDAFLGWDLGDLADATGSYVQEHVPLKAVSVADWDLLWEQHCQDLRQQ